MIELALNGIQKYYGATKVVDNVTFEVQTEEKVGLIGRNGTGKTTILKMIAGLEKQDSGLLTIRKGSAIGYLDQIPDYPENFTSSDILNTAFEKQHELNAQMKTLEMELGNLQDKALDSALKKYGELQQLFEHSGGYEIEEKLSKICTGLKLSSELLSRPFSTLSGGEKTTVILGKILLQAPDILLLDEPSNHLDVESIEWLEDFLKDYKGVALMVSHDRYFLDRVVTKIVELEDMETTTYIGNYSSYVKQKETNMMLQFEAYQDQQKKIKVMEKAIKDLRDWAIRADNNKFFRRAASMQKRLDKMQRIEKPVLEKDNMKLNVLDCERSGKDVVKVEKLCKSFGEKAILCDADALIRFGEKVSLIGNNGCGKSTLIKLLLGQYSVDSGTASLGASVKVGYLPQNITFNNEELTILECFREDITMLEGKAREYLSKYMFYGESVFKKVKNLSGGEKSRLMLCKLLYEEVNLLILDEPTNHLDIESRETLEETLSSFEGTVLFISHDRYFINKLSSRILELKNHKLTSYDGNYEYYKEKKLQLAAAEKAAEENKANFKDAKASKEVKNNKNSTSTDSITDAVKAKSKEEKLKEAALKKLEEQIAQLEEAIFDLDIKMADKTLSYTKLNELFEEKTSLQQQLDTVMEQWVELG